MSSPELRLASFMICFQVQFPSAYFQGLDLRSVVSEKMFNNTVTDQREQDIPAGVEDCWAKGMG